MPTQRTIIRPTRSSSSHTKFKTGTTRVSGNPKTNVNVNMNVIIEQIAEQVSGGTGADKVVLTQILNQLSLQTSNVLGKGMTQKMILHIKDEVSKDPRGLVPQALWQFTQAHYTDTFTIARLTANGIETITNAIPLAALQRTNPSILSDIYQISTQVSNKFGINKATVQQTLEQLALQITNTGGKIKASQAISLLKNNIMQYTGNIDQSLFQLSKEKSQGNINTVVDNYITRLAQQQSNGINLSTALTEIIPPNPIQNPPCTQNPNVPGCSQPEQQLTATNTNTHMSIEDFQQALQQPAEQKIIAEEAAKAHIPLAQANLAFTDCFKDDSCRNTSESTICMGTTALHLIAGAACAALTTGFEWGIQLAKWSDSITNPTAQVQQPIPCDPSQDPNCLSPQTRPTICDPDHDPNCVRPQLISSTCPDGSQADAKGSCPNRTPIVSTTTIPTATTQQPCIDNPAIGFTCPASPALANPPAVDCTANPNDPSCPTTPPPDPCSQDPSSPGCQPTSPPPTSPYSWYGSHQLQKSA